MQGSVAHGHGAVKTTLPMDSSCVDSENDGQKGQRTQRTRGRVVSSQPANATGLFPQGLGLWVIFVCLPNVNVGFETLERLRLTFLQLKGRAFFRGSWSSRLRLRKPNVLRGFQQLLPPPFFKKVPPPPETQTSSKPSSNRACTLPNPLKRARGLECIFPGMHGTYHFRPPSLRTTVRESYWTVLQMVTPRAASENGDLSESCDPWSASRVSWGVR